MLEKKISKKFVIKINNFIKKKLNLDKVYVCYHDDHHNCNCRKPKTEMIISAAKNWKINIKESILVGDRKKILAIDTALDLNVIL